MSVGLAAALLGSSVTVAAADRQAVVATIHEPGGVVATPPAVTIERLEASANPCMTYSGPAPALYDQSGSVQAQPPGPNSWSLATVLECGLVPGVALNAVTEVVVRQLSGAAETGRASTLSTADLSATGDFADSAQPLIAYDGSNILYYRPWRGGSDQNYRDKVEEPPPSPLAIDVYEGPPLTVVAQESSGTVTAGAVVDFSATVSDAGGGAPPDQSTLSYSWDFDGGAASSTAAAPKVTFPTAGTYSVTVQVTDTAGGGGADTTLLTVNPAANTPTTPAPPANAPPTGPANSNGATPHGIAGKHTASHGATTKSPAAKPTHGTKSSAAAGTKAQSKTTTQPAPSPPSTTTATPGAGTTAPPASHHAAHSSTPVKGPAQGASGLAAGAATIDGRLISDVAPLPVESSPLVRVVVASPATAPEVRRPTGSSILPAVAALLTILVLLSLGARHQLGWRRRPGTVVLGG
ncbi:MAG TPA: PKD domain-containing protein [Solirubrobacteraceae bacterium]